MPEGVQPMRILLLSQFFAPVIGGEERHVITLSEALAARGHEVSVASLAHPERRDVEIHRGATVRSLRGTFQRAAGIFKETERPHAPPFPDPELTLQLRDIMAWTKPDVVHAHNWLVHSYLPLHRSAKAGLVMTIHDHSMVCARKSMMRKGEPCSHASIGRCLPCASEHFGSLKGPVVYFGNRISTAFERKAVDRFITVSRDVAKRSGLASGSAPYEVLPTFIADDLADLVPPSDPRLDLLPKEPYLLFVGDLSRNKGALLLLEAYRRLSNPPPLVMIGRRLPDTPTDMPPGVILLESWPHALVMHAWSRCLFGMAPSIWPEACGTIVMEANAVGRPMIASRTGGLQDLVVDGKTGLLVEPGDADALTAAMHRLLTDRDERETMGHAARRHSDTFKASAILPKIERIYREVMPLASRAAPVRGEVQQTSPTPY